MIFKRGDDQEAKDLVNSFKHASASPRKHRIWSPELSFEERYRLKRKREDEYVQEYYPEDRPILLIKEKHQYQNIRTDNVFQDPTEREDYYKISKNTELVDNIGDEIQEQFQYTQRQT